MAKVSELCYLGMYEGFLMKINPFRPNVNLICAMCRRQCKSVRFACNNVIHAVEVPLNDGAPLHNPLPSQKIYNTNPFEKCIVIT